MDRIQIAGDFLYKKEQKGKYQLLKYLLARKLRLMMYLLIDTCSWSRLLQDTQNTRVSLLYHWHQTEQVKILLPSLILSEWERHKEGNLREATQNIEVKVRGAHEITRLTGKETISLPPLTPAIFERIQIIESILAGSIQFDVPESIKAMCADIAMTKKAPFHNKARSMADAFILYSAFWYCKTNKITELGFVSNNTDDFAIKKNAQELHTDLLESAKEFGINITYYNDIVTAINLLLKTLAAPPKDLNKKKVTPKDYIYIDRNLDPTTQLYNYLKSRYYDIRFLPASLITDHYPFTDVHFILRKYTTFRLHFDREELYNTLKTGRETLDREADSNSKECFIFRTLNNNYIYQFYYRPKKVYIETKLPTPLRNEHSNTGHRVFDYKTAKEEIETHQEGVIKRMQQAYTNYQLGRFQEAAWLFYDIAQNAKEEGRNTSYIICLFNLKRLKSLMILKQNVDEKLLACIEDIDIEEELYKVSTEENVRLHRFIVREEFFHNQIQHVHDARKLLIDSYFNKLAGGYSDDQFIYSLICVFAQIDQFVQANYIIYEHTYDYIHTLADSLLEGVMVSHSTPKKHQSKLPLFDNYIFLRIIRFARPDNILKYFNRYNLHELKYHQTSIPVNDCFHKYVENFFSNAPSFLDDLQSNTPYQTQYLKEKTTNVLENMMVLLAITDIPGNIFTGFITLMSTFLYKAPISCQCKYLEELLIRKKSMFSKNQLDELLRLFSEQEQYRNGDLLAALLYAYVEVGITDSLSEQYKKLVNEALAKYQISSLLPISDVLPALYAVSSEAERINLTNEISSLLEKDFYPALFYDACLFDLIDCNPIQLEQLITFVGETKDKHKLLVDYDSSDSFQTYEMNALFNLCLKVNCDFTRTIFEQVKGIAPYYDWLMDIERYDYDSFDFDWLCINNTIYLKKHFKRSTFLMNKLIEYLKVQKDFELEKLLLQLTYYTD